MYPTKKNFWVKLIKVRRDFKVRILTIYIISASVLELGKLKTESSYALIIAALKDENENVRCAAVLALMEIESDRSVDVLMEMREDEDFEVRMYAKEALKRICSKKVGKK